MKKSGLAKNAKSEKLAGSAKPAEPTEDFLDAWAGPVCKSCGHVRTKNPTGECARCLGPRCCKACYGRGWRGQPPVGCKRCSGKGTFEPLPAETSSAARVVPEGDKWVVELLYEGRIVRVGSFTNESIARRVAERGERAVGSGVSGFRRRRRLTEVL